MAKLFRHLTADSNTETRMDNEIARARVRKILTRLSDRMEDIILGIEDRNDSKDSLRRKYRELKNDMKDMLRDEQHLLSEEAQAMYFPAVREALLELNLPTNAKLDSRLAASVCDAQDLINHYLNQL